MGAQIASIGDQALDLISVWLGGYAALTLQILKIIGINIVLSGDNAVVIALACRSLPRRQRMMGIILGAGAAVVLRIIFTVLVQHLLGVPYLKLVGGLLLFWIAIKLLTSEEANEDSVAAGNTLFEAIKIVAIADMVMSLDNVLAISIPLVVGGATLIMALLTRYPILVWAGAALLGWVAGELIATEELLKPHMAELAEGLGVTVKLIARACEAVGALIVVALGSLMRKREAAHMLAREHGHGER